jgi:hypothetical protein
MLEVCHCLQYWNAISWHIKIDRSQAFECPLERAKKAFFSDIDASFGKIGRLLSQEVTLKLFQ